MPGILTGIPVNGPSKPFALLHSICLSLMPIDAGEVLRLAIIGRKAPNCGHGSAGSVRLHPLSLGTYACCIHTTTHNDVSREIGV